MEVTINYNGQAVAVEVTLEVYEFLDRANHKTENLFHEQRRHWDGREFDEYIITTEGVGAYGETPEEYLCRMETPHELMAVLPVALAHATLAQARRVHAYYIAGIEQPEISGERVSTAARSAFPSVGSAPVLCASEMDGQSMSVSKEKRCLT